VAPVAGTAELHQMVMDDGVMRMRAVAGPGKGGSILAAAYFSG